MQGARGKIVILTYEFPPVVGGISRYIAVLAEGLGRRGWTVKVMAPVGSTAVGPSYECVPTLTGIVRRDTANLLGLAGRYRPDWAIVAHPLGWRACFAFWVRRIPSLYIGYGSEFALVGRGRPIRDLLWRLSLELSREVVAISRYSASRMLEAHPPLRRRKVHVVYPGLEDVWFDREPRRNHYRERLGLGERRTVLTVARLVRRKGFAPMLRAAPRLMERIPGFVHLIAGAGPMQGEIEDLVAQLHLKDHIRLLGNVADADLPFIYDACDVFAMLSQEERGTVEGFGYAFVEAGARGRTAVGGRHGGVPEAIEDGETGFLVGTGQEDAYVSNLTRLLQDRDLRQRMGEAARRRAEERFTIGAMVNSFSEIMQPVGGGR